MNLDAIKDRIMRSVVNIPGWSTKRKIVVIESDDWGSIRMSSKENREKLIKEGFSFEGQAFNLYDALESNEDLSMLYEVLSRHKDSTGRHPVFTAVSIVGNPDFEKIETSGFTNYYWEHFTETLKRYPEHDHVYELYKEGIENRLFYPIFHGREHLNAQRWLRALQCGNKSVRLAFEHGVTGVHLGINNEPLGDLQAAFDLEYPSDLPFMEMLIREGLDTFEKLWGFKAVYFVPTNGPFNNSLTKVLYDKKIRYLLAERHQKEPLGNGIYKTHFHYLGQQNKYKQLYLTRNVFFEPSNKQDYLREQPVEKCLLSIERAFRWGKPATISSHRVNYIGFIEEENRANSLRLLEDLLERIIKRWPEVEFMTSVELGDLIRKDKKGKK
jgi:hypothetical protein